MARIQYIRNKKGAKTYLSAQPGNKDLGCFPHIQDRWDLTNCEPYFINQLDIRGQNSTTRVDECAANEAL